MQRHCGTCDTDYDDETCLAICPHHVGELVRLLGANITMDCIDELTTLEMQELEEAQYFLITMPRFPAES